MRLCTDYDPDDARPQPLQYCRVYLFRVAPPSYKFQFTTPELRRTKRRVVMGAFGLRKVF